MTTLPHGLRELAARTTNEQDAGLLWRAARQLETLYGTCGIPLDEDVIPEPLLPDLEAARRQGERRMLLSVLFSTKGNKSAAARRLRISRVALYKSLMKHELNPR